MTENVVSQVVSSMYNKSINKVLHKVLLVKCCCNSSNLNEYW